MHKITFKSQLLDDGHLYCPEKYAKPNLMFNVVVSFPGENETDSKNSRPFGLCKGDFNVPDDFDSPLPEDIIKEFEGNETPA